MLTVRVTVATVIVTLQVIIGEFDSVKLQSLGLVSS